MVKSRARSSPYQISSYTSTYATPVKGKECFWKWRIIVTSYSGLQIRKEKVEHFLTADCKSAGTPNGRKEDLKYPPTSWFPLAQQVLGERISAVMQAHNSCCAAGEIGFSGLYY